MDAFEAAIGKSVSVRKTVSESDVYLFAGITGDFSPNHVDEAFMRTTRYGHRIAHGALLVGYMSRASTLIADKCPALVETRFPVSLGYDRIRFLHAVTIGDTIIIDYRISSADASRGRTLADVELRSDGRALCAVATHIMSWIVRSVSI
jgi:acyl dehydratase